MGGLGCIYNEFGHKLFPEIHSKTPYTSETNLHSMTLCYVKHKMDRAIQYNVTRYIAMETSYCGITSCGI